jgi:UDP-hydrolysing UDP-N-acetyl-D-glucosamine 2-epimerase
MKTVLVMIGSRANYASIKSVMRAISEHHGLSLITACFASATLPKFGKVYDQIERDGFSIAVEINSQIEGDSLASMAESTGLALLKLPQILSSLRPDLVVTVGDRYETLATAIAASYMNIPLAHTMGGEISGSIDESVRHAITKLSNLHFPATRQSAEILKKLGENPSAIFTVGCPRIDLAKQARDDMSLRGDLSLSFGVGDQIDFSLPFLMVSQHSVTTEYLEADEQIARTMTAVKKSAMPTVVLWPNADPGGDRISQYLRTMREHGLTNKLHFYRNLPAEVYMWLMARTSCLVGNSSSGIREGAYLGTPVVNIGSRQLGRERAKNVIDVGYEPDAISEAIQHQIVHGKYESSQLYGDGNAGLRVAEVIYKANFQSTQKNLAY